MRCERPGCTGVIEDGYCNVCGLAPAKAPRDPPASSGGAKSPGRAGVLHHLAGPAGSGATSARSAGTRPSSSSSASQLRGASSRTRTTGRSHLGAGLVEVPPVPYLDPATAVLAHPEVPQDRRFCANCGQPVGRDRAGVKGKTEGFCRNCGHHYSFAPKLGRGMVVGAQYEVAGCLAHGGLGWIYLARDRHVSDRWVVLKGLLDSGDDDAMAAAMGERRFLAEVEHPNIVKIFNFVQHEGSGYIVMEYVGGSSLKDLLKQRRSANGGEPDPIPVDQAIAYILEILPALGYLHSIGLLYCDFKPDNVMQTDEALKLLDLGGVRRIDDAVSPVYGTVGFQAPEIADAGPSVASDVYTVARTLAVLTIDFKGYQGARKFAIPAPDEVPLFARFDSLYRFLVKATAGEPADRFQSADEMAQQLVGVLREVVAAGDGIPRPAPSDLFTSDLEAGQEPDWRRLPGLRVASTDPAAGFLASITVTDPVELVDLLRAAPVDTVELDLRLARSLIEADNEAAAEQILAAIERGDPHEWRVQWYRGLIALNRGAPGPARAQFEHVYAECPGELAPKLALGVAAETANDSRSAVRWYDLVSRTDPSFTTASFGLGRCRAALGDRAGAVEAYNRVPDGSSSHLDAQVCAARALIETGSPTPPTLTELSQAAATVERLDLSGEDRVSLSAAVLEAALQLLRSGHIHTDSSVKLAGESVTEQRLRVGLERAYRALARLAPTAEERISLVDRANHTRPRTLL